MKCARKRSSWPALGMTLPETLIGLTVGFLVLAGMGTVFLTSNRGFVSMGNYVALDQSSRLALQRMTRDMRNAQNLTSFATNELVFTLSGSNNLVYSYSPSAQQLTSWQTGSSTNILLTGCDFLSFTMFSNVPQPGGTFTNVTSVGQAKAISVAWRCSRTILGNKLNTEDIQEAVIVIRNKIVQ